MRRATRTPVLFRNLPKPGFGWDPSTITNPPISLGNLNQRLVMLTGQSSYAAVTRATRLAAAGKFYFEVAVVDVIDGNSTTTGIGWANSGASFNSGASIHLQSDCASVWPSGSVYVGGSIVLTDATIQYGDGDRLMFAVDTVTGKVWIGKNGTWGNSGNPAAGTGPVTTLSTGLSFYPAATPWSSGTGTVTLDIFSTGNLSFTVPAGFTTL